LAKTGTPLKIVECSWLLSYHCIGFYVRFCGTGLSRTHLLLSTEVPSGNVTTGPSKF